MMMEDETELSSEICEGHGEVALAHKAPRSQHARLVAELTQAVHARDAFIAIAAHELRNSMTPMLGYVEHILSVGRRPGSECPATIIVALERLANQMAEYISERRRFSTSRALPRESFAPNFRWSISPQ
jgi:signal transduction histidine kinase